jgi:hypothetical protein
MADSQTSTATENRPVDETKTVTPDPETSEKKKTKPKKKSPVSGETEPLVETQKKKKKKKKHKTIVPTKEHPERSATPQIKEEAPPVTEVETVMPTTVDTPVLDVKEDIPAPTVKEENPAPAVEVDEEVEEVNEEQKTAKTDGEKEEVVPEKEADTMEDDEDDEEAQPLPTVQNEKKKAVKRKRSKEVADHQTTKRTKNQAVVISTIDETDPGTIQRRKRGTKTLETSLRGEEEKYRKNYRAGNMTIFSKFEPIVQNSFADPELLNIGWKERVIDFDFASVEELMQSLGPFPSPALMAKVMADPSKYEPELRILAYRNKGTSKKKLGTYAVFGRAVVVYADPEAVVSESSEDEEGPVAAEQS